MSVYQRLGLLVNPMKQKKHEKTPLFSQERFQLAFLKKLTSRENSVFLLLLEAYECSCRSNSQNAESNKYVRGITGLGVLLGNNCGL